MEATILDSEARERPSPSQTHSVEADSGGRLERLLARLMVSANVVPTGAPEGKGTWDGIRTNIVFRPFFEVLAD